MKNDSYIELGKVSNNLNFLRIKNNGDSHETVHLKQVKPLADLQLGMSAHLWRGEAKSLLDRLRMRERSGSLVPDRSVPGPWSVPDRSPEVIPENMTHPLFPSQFRFQDNLTLFWPLVVYSTTGISHLNFSSCTVAAEYLTVFCVVNVHESKPGLNKLIKIISQLDPLIKIIKI